MFRFLIFFVATSTCFFAQAETLQTPSPVLDKDTYSLVYQSAENFLAYETEDVSGGLMGDLEDLKIVELNVNNGLIQFMKVNYTAYFFTTDYDFGDPVHEEHTNCTTELTPNNAGIFSLELTKTVCDLNPKTDLDDDYGYPCCENGSPVVDSNMCFDSLEEAGDFCKR